MLGVDMCPNEAETSIPGCVPSPHLLVLFSATFQESNLNDPSQSLVVISLFLCFLPLKHKRTMGTHKHAPLLLRRLPFSYTSSSRFKVSTNTPNCTFPCVLLILPSMVKVSLVLSILKGKSSVIKECLGNWSWALQYVSGIYFGSVLFFPSLSQSVKSS